MYHYVGLMHQLTMFFFVLTSSDYFWSCPPWQVSLNCSKHARQLLSEAVLLHFEGCQTDFCTCCGKGGTIMGSIEILGYILRLHWDNGKGNANDYNGF